jgi:hypothetical protein
MEMNDQQFTVLNHCVYYECDPFGTCEGFRTYKTKVGEHGFAAAMYVKVIKSSHS